MPRVCTRIFFPFATIFANLIFFCAIFFNFEPDFEPNFGHFSPKNYLVRKKGVHLLIPITAAVDSRISYSVKCVRDLNLILTLIFKTSVINYNVMN